MSNTTEYNNITTNQQTAYSVGYTLPNCPPHLIFSTSAPWHYLGHTVSNKSNMTQFPVTACTQFDRGWQVSSPMSLHGDCTCTQVTLGVLLLIHWANWWINPLSLGRRGLDIECVIFKCFGLDWTCLTTTHVHISRPFSNVLYWLLLWAFPVLLTWSEWHRNLQMISICLGNGLVPSGNKTLPEPMLFQIYDNIWWH